MHGKTPTDIPIDGEKLYDSTEVRELLGGLSESTFRRLTGSGQLKAVKQGSRVYVRASVLAAYIESLPAA